MATLLDKLLLLSLFDTKALHTVQHVHTTTVLDALAQQPAANRILTVYVLVPLIQYQSPCNKCTHGHTGGGARAHQHCLAILVNTKELVSQPDQCMAQLRFISKL